MYIPKSVSNVRDIDVDGNIHMEVGNTYKIRGTATILVLNREGLILYTHIGYRAGDAKKYKEEIEKVLSM